jgi:uncharacterized membrane protein YbhN (UPF0104 family)
MLEPMGRIWAALRTKTARRTLNAVSVVFGVGFGYLAYRHFAETGWPLKSADPKLVAASGLCFLLAYALKAFGWHRLFAPGERPEPMALAAAGGAASLTGAALPGRFDDVVRVAVVRRYPGTTSGIPALALSLFMLGLVDAAALMPLASAAAAASDTTVPVRAGLGVVAFAGLTAGIVVMALPRIAASGRLVRFRVARWVDAHTGSAAETAKSIVLVLGSWTTRAVAILFLLQALGVSISIPMAIAFLVAAAASGALPVAPAGAATQAGAGAAILIASGVSTAQAIAFAVAAQALLIFAGGAVVLAAAAWGSARAVAGRRAAA